LSDRLDLQVQNALGPFDCVRLKLAQVVAATCWSAGRGAYGNLPPTKRPTENQHCKFEEITRCPCHRWPQQAADECWHDRDRKNDDNFLQDKEGLHNCDRRRRNHRDDPLSSYSTGVFVPLVEIQSVSSLRSSRRRACNVFGKRSVRTGEIHAEIRGPWGLLTRNQFAPAMLCAIVLTTCCVIVKKNGTDTIQANQIAAFAICWCSPPLGILNANPIRIKRAP
jgi:hypothetical protein